MRALTWQGREKVSVEEVPDPRIEEPTDAVVRVTSTAICGSDLHLYSVLGMYLDPGDVLGHETMGVVEEVGANATRLKVGDRVVVPFGIACGTCWMCTHGLQSQCETTQVRSQDKGAALFGYTKLYGQVPGGQAEYLRVPQAHYGPVVVPADGPDERYLYLSDVLPTAWQAVEYAAVPPGGTVAVVGLGPIGQMAARVARHRGAGQVVGLDLVPERLEMARRHGIEVVDLSVVDDVVGAVRDLTQGRGADGVIDAVGMEAHGSPGASLFQKAAGVLPDTVAGAINEKVGVDRLAALLTAISLVRRGGTLSIAGVYGGAKDPLPMMDLFDRQVTLRMGQANVRRWIDDLLPLVSDPADPLGVLDLRTHRLSLEDAPRGYDLFQKKEDGCIKVVLDPTVRTPSAPDAPDDAGSR
ncbi:glutathione-dependent formaldehyde dehydrogenase [Oerskovia turbata]|uniref:Glutathione-dependent formaldehyde dehydrogenase n=1 Tax=Oerskovia turbata TaxID=1713 RepID=A0A4Q1KQ56_9CELL|nr:zinc-dependent alcohol dehydrogenase [Oerskovia turbata]RXR26062.1 glutathione-dependent formaldehyde dehydrogenase [Oerskovia turbata]RXR31630.1 glutathione-dependent formaldehyde dehydrogenase [Oerskovia turbata]TGJ97264.1 glutathione-dependent formaldehyde dehydrogenase [Actinotalea fermentans ATCC 43279 = JCM 9966 = DSM 3133]